VKGTFTVPALDARYRYGVLARPAEYKAWIRYSSGDTRIQPDSVKDARGMAVKLMGVPGEKLLADERDADTQDFVMINSRVFFIRDVDQYAEFAARLSRGDRYGFFFAGGPFRPWEWRLRELWLGTRTLKRPPPSPLRTDYDSLAAFKLGPAQNVKFGVRPCTENLSRPAPDARGPNALREALAADLAAGAACFDFVVQLQRADRNMPVEDATVLWSEKDSPFVTVARLDIPRQEFDTPAQNDFCEALSFTPWHALPDHRPIGVMNRLRKAVYLEVSRYRRAKNGAPAAEPRGWCLDLTGKSCGGV
jgi:catalase